MDVFPVETSYEIFDYLIRVDLCALLCVSKLLKVSVEDYLEYRDDKWTLDYAIKRNDILTGRIIAMRYDYDTLFEIIIVYNMGIVLDICRRCLPELHDYLKNNKDLPHLKYDYANYVYEIAEEKFGKLYADYVKTIFQPHPYCNRDVSGSCSCSYHRWPVMNQVVSKSVRLSSHAENINIMETPDDFEKSVDKPKSIEHYIREEELRMKPFTCKDIKGIEYKLKGQHNKSDRKSTRYQNNSRNKISR